MEHFYFHKDKRVITHAVEIINIKPTFHQSQNSCISHFVSFLHFHEGIGLDFPSTDNIFYLL